MIYCLAVGVNFYQQMSSTKLKQQLKVKKKSIILQKNIMTSKYEEKQSVAPKLVMINITSAITPTF